MRKILLSLGLLSGILFSARNSYSQEAVGIGTTSPNPNSILDLDPSGTLGFLMPRLNAVDTATLGNAGINVGMIFYALDLQTFMYFDGTYWVEVGTGASGGSGLDGKTLLNGTIDPTGADGVDGDFFINTTSTTIFGPKSGGVWPAGVLLIGSTGANGADGLDGDRYATSSTDNLTINTGIQNFTIDISLAYTVAQTVIIANSGTDFMEGTVTAYNPLTGAMAVNVVSITGAGAFASWSVNLAGAPGPAGTDGNTILSGAGVPGAGTGVDGDFYIDNTIPVIYGPKTAGAWPTPGDTLVGADGAAGIAGLDGADGNTVLNGLIDPTTEGVDGDFYINTATDSIFGPKTAGAWGAGTSLVGADGAAGPAGAAGTNGNTILSGAGVPGAGTGVDGDFYIDNTIPVIYGPKAAGAWPTPGDTLIGADGLAGTNGIDGLDGADGQTVLNAAIDPTGLDGVDGDFFINTATNVIFGPKAAGVWPAGVSLVGPTGPAGIDGDQYATSSTDNLTIALGAQSFTVATGLAYTPGQTVIIANSGTDFMEGTVTSYTTGSGAMNVNVTNITGGGTFASWSVNLAGAPGPAGTDGNTVLNGGVDPTAPVGNDGDFYINTGSNTIFGPKAAGAWPAGVALVGAAGSDGNTVLNGLIDPTTEGVDGDFYINTATDSIFGPKTAGLWGAGTSLVGADGAIGAAGTNGNTILSGAGVPGAGTGVDGDFYIDNTIPVIYGPKTAGAWPTPGDTLIGADGAAGIAGLDGADGNTVLNGLIDPTTEGVDGDFYINTATDSIFGPKTAGLWGAGTSLVGADGAAGPAGAAGTNGNTILSGPGVPGAGTGVDGDFYIDNTIPVIYGPKAAGAWPTPGDTLIGADGLAGTNGINGLDGADGQTVLNAAIDPTGLDGVDGDFFINTATNVIFGPKAAGVWPAGVSLVGPTGPAGIDGDQYASSSTDNLTIALGAQSFTVATGLAYTPGQTVIIANSGTDFMEGTVTSYTTGSGAMNVNVTNITGGGTFASWSVNLAGAPGPAGTDGNTVLNGGVDPTALVGNDGDFYINTGSNTIFGPKAAGAWPAGVALVGAAGSDGNTVLNGLVDPTTEGVDGDFYINTATDSIFGPKTAGLWGAGTSLIGADGAAGAAGTDGNTILSGPGVPGAGTGVDGDFYIDNTIPVIYGPKTAGAWPTPGDTLIGADGAAGIAGLDGADGNTVLNGLIDPTTEGVDGDFYINTATDSIFGPKTAGLWGAGTSLIGADGAAGVDGLDGNTVLNGAIDPTAGDGVDGDFYINTTADVIFGPKAGGIWPTPGDTLIGADGLAGTDGNTIVSGTVAPTTEGVDGDFYFDTDDLVWYGPKAAGTWPASGDTILGTDGTDGNTILNGTGVPINGIGNDGDFFIDNNAKVIYGPKAAGAWPTPGDTLIVAAGANDTIPANVFSARIDNNGIVTLIHSSYNFIQSVNRPANGVIEINYVPGFFTQEPAVTANAADDQSVFAAIDDLSTNVNTLRIVTRINGTNTPTDADIYVIVQRQGLDYQNTLTAPPNVIGYWQSNGTGIYNDTANVGIGTTNTPAPLTIRTQPGTDIEFENSGDDADIAFSGNLNIFTGSEVNVDATIRSSLSSSGTELNVTGDGVGINQTPNANASLALGGNTKGLQLNRVDTTTLQPSLGTNDHGLVVYDTIIGQTFVWNGTNFEAVGGSSSQSLQSAYDGGQTINMGSGNIDFISGAANSVLYVDEANERIGIGTTSPTFDLELSGGATDPVLGITTTNLASFATPRIEFSSGIYNADVAGTRNNATWQIGLRHDNGGGVSNAADRFYIGRSAVSSLDFTLSRDGNVGIGVVGNYKLDVLGNVNIDVSYAYLQGGTHLISQLAASQNVFVGGNTNAATGANNTVVGFDAGNTIGAGTDNTVMGYRAGQTLNNGSSNTMIGKDAGNQSFNTSNNTFIGDLAGEANFSGQNNTMVGRNTGASSTSGNAITLLGTNANATNGLTNATAIGAGAVVGASNSLVLGNGATNVGIGTQTPANKLEVIGDAAKFDSVIIVNGAQAGYVLTSAGVSGAASWQQLPVATAWDLLGNAGTVDGTNFIGTTDNVPLNFRVNNTFAGQIEPGAAANTFMGHNTGLNANSNINATAFGAGALSSLTSGDANTAIGVTAMNSMLTGTGNVGIGFNALRFSTTGVDNVAIGYSNMVSGSGDRNVSVGAYGMQLKTGLDNVSVGYGAYSAVGTSNYATAIGRSALSNVSTGWGNTALGYTAGDFITTGSNNTFIGNNADAAIATLSNATAIGYNAVVGASNSLVLGNGSVNVGIGTSTPANKLEVIGDAAKFDSVIIVNGAQAGYVLTSADASGAASWQQLPAATAWDLLGNAGTVDGTNFIGTTDAVALNFRMNNQPSGRIDNATTGNTTFGYQSGNNGAGFNNAAFGFRSLASNTVDGNSAFGSLALENNVTGLANTAIGYGVLQFNDGVQNTGVGNAALLNNAGGADNAALGYLALLNNVNSSGNTAIGSSSLQNSDGVGNTALGYSSGFTNASGTENTFIGYNADASAGNFSNATAIGANAVVGASNSLVLGNGANVGIGTSTPTADLTIYDDVPGGYVYEEIFNSNSTGYTSLDLINDVNRMELRYEGSAVANPSFRLFDVNAASSRIIVDTSGNVGIGSNQPQVELDVTFSKPAAYVVIESENLDATGGSAIVLSSDANSFYLATEGSATGTGDEGSFYIFDAVGGTTPFYINPLGFVGIGATAPTTQLQVNDYSSAQDNYISVKTAGGNSYKAGLKLNHFDDSDGFTLESDESINKFIIRRQAGPTDTAVFAIDRLENYVGIGTIYPEAMLTVGPTNGFKVDSTGDITRIKGLDYVWPSAQGAGTLSNDGTGTLVWAAPSGIVADNGLTIVGSDLDLGGALNQNTILGAGSFGFAIGTGNTIGGSNVGSIAMGISNTVNSTYSFAFGTSNNTSGARSFAIGNFATAAHLGSMVLGDWSGSSPEATSSSNIDQFTARFDNGFRFRTTSNVISNPNEGVFINGSGLMGIGTNNPQELLHLSGGTMRFQDFAGNGRKVLTINNFGNVGFTEIGDSILWYANGNDILNKNSGAVIIGTGTINNAKLQITTELNENSIHAWKYNNTATGTQIRLLKARGTEALPTAVLNNDAIASFIGTGYHGAGFSNAGSINLVATEAWTAGGRGSKMEFETVDLGTTASSVKMTLSSEGNLGIGTTNPLDKLHINSGTSSVGLRLDNTLAGNTILDLYNNGTLGTRYQTTSTQTNIISQSTRDINMFTNGFNRMTIDGLNGNVGIGTTNPLYKLSVNGPANLNEGIAGGVPALYVNGAEALWYNGTYFSWGFGGTANFFADNVGIGTSTPVNSLDVEGGAAIGSAYSGTNSAQADGLIVQENVGIGYNGASDLYQLRSDIASTNTTTPNNVYLINNYSGTSSKYGIYNTLSVDGTSTKTGIYSVVQGPSGNASQIFGNRVFINHAGTGIVYGNYIDANKAASQTGDLYGQYIISDNDGTGNSYLMYANSVGSTTGIEYGLYTVGEDQNYFSNNVKIGGTGGTTTSKLFVDGGTTQGDLAVTVTSADTWGTAINLDASGGGGSAYQLVSAGSAHPTLPAGSFGISASTGPIFYVDGANANIFMAPSSTQQISFGSATPSNDKLYVNANDASINTGLDVEIIKSNGASGYGLDVLSTVNTGSGSAYGVYSIANGTSTGTKYGVFGGTGGSGTRYGVYCSGNGGYTGSWTLVSDQSLKKNIRNYQGALQNVMQLEPKQYQYRTDELSYMNMKEGEQIGLIAQDVQKVFPHVVSENKHPGPTNEKGEFIGQEKSYLGIDYIQLVPILTQAIKEQQDLIQNQNEAIQNLEERLRALENK